ncbi:MAG: dual specificity protein phosphatase family protein [Bradymonadia bacterium]
MTHRPFVLGGLIPRFSWVIPGQLAGSGMPARADLGKDVEAYVTLYEEGVRVVLSLLESAPPKAVIEQAGLMSLHFPIHDLDTPTEISRYVEVLDESHAHVTAGRPVLVHCYAGIGRTGMTLAAWMVRYEGISPRAAIDHVRTLRPGSIETPGQAAFLSTLRR